MTTSPPPAPSSSLFGGKGRPGNWATIGIAGALAIGAAVLIRVNLPAKPVEKPADQAWSEMQAEARRLMADGGLIPAQEIAESAIPLAQKAFGNDHPAVAESFIILAETLYQQGRYPAAGTYYAMALEMLVKIYGPGSSEAAAGAGAYALNLLKEERYPEAKRLLDRAVEISEELAGPDHVDTALAVNNLAVMYYTIDDPAAAQPLFERALSIRLKVTGPASRLTAASRSSLAACLRRRVELGHVPEPEVANAQARIDRLYRQSLATRERLLGPDHLDVSLTLVGLSALRRLEGNLVEADLNGLAALAIREAKLGREHVSTVAALDNLGQVRADQELNDEARRYFEFCADMRALTLGPLHHDTLESLAHLVATLLAEKDFKAAEKLLEVLIAGLERTALPQPEKLQAAFDDLARVLAEMGRTSEKPALEERASKAVAAAEARAKTFLSPAPEKAMPDRGAGIAKPDETGASHPPVDPVEPESGSEKSDTAVVRETVEPTP